MFSSMPLICWPPRHRWVAASIFARVAAAAARSRTATALVGRSLGQYRGLASLPGAEEDEPLTFVVPMPQLSPAMSEGTISRWLVEQGGPVVAGEVFLEVITTTVRFLVPPL